MYRANSVGKTTIAEEEAFSPSLSSTDSSAAAAAGMESSFASIDQVTGAVVVRRRSR